ncbi:hypothetical protein BGZ97_000942, partial [Linnemannia gamsii]
MLCVPREVLHQSSIDALNNCPHQVRPLVFPPDYILERLPAAPLGKLDYCQMEFSYEPENECYNFFKSTGLKDPIRRLLKWSFQPKHNRIPSSPAEVLARRIQDTVNYGICRENDNERQRSLQRSVLLKEYQLRYLVFQSLRGVLDVPTFHQILRKCSNLQQLIMYNIWDATPPETWSIISTYCRQLCVLEVYVNKYSPQTISDFLSLYPCLHTLSLYFQVTASDHGMSNIGPTLQQHQEKYGSKHPLRCLHLNGSVYKPFETLVTALTLCSIEFESLMLNSIFGNVPVLTIEPSECPLSFDWARSVRSLDTLERLSISGVGFQDKAVLVQFFTQLQVFGRLRFLSLSIVHLRQLISNPVDPAASS